MSKKLIAIALAGIFAFSAVSVKADTLSDLQAIITSLTAQIAALQAQITALGGGTTTVCFNTDLSQGMTSNDVKNLQIKLGVTPTSGYFGPITLAAVKTFQTAHGVINTGYVGPLTRASLNTLYCTPTTTTTIATGYPAGCTSAVGFSTTTGLSCAGTVSYPAGCTSTAGFSSTTGLSCATPVAATEGTLTITQNPIPGSGTVIVYGGNVQKEISAYRIRATNSDIRVKRVVLQFNLVNNFPWRDLSAISIWDGTTILKEVTATSAYFTEATFATIYTMTLDGLDVLVAKDTEKVLSVKATAVSVPATGGIAMTVLIPALGVRGVDTTSLNVYGPAAGLAAQIFTTAPAQAPTLTVTAATDNPLAGNVIADPANITRVDLLKIAVKADNIDMTWKGGLVNVTQNAATGSVSAVELYDGTTLLASAAGPGLNTTATPCAFGTYTLAQAAGTTKTLTVKGVIVANPSANTIISAALPANTGLTGIDSNSAVRTNGVAGAVAGNNLRVYLNAPIFAYVSSTATVTGTNSTTHPQDTGNTAITFSVTAKGGDIYIPQNGNATATLGMIGLLTGPNATATQSVTWTCVSPALAAGSASDPALTQLWRIPNGQTANCTFNDLVTNTTGTAGFFSVALNSVDWDVNTTDDAGVINQTWGLTNITTANFPLGI